MNVRIFAVANQKGGVGKTTTAINMSAALAMRGYQTLLIDFDPQGNASTGLGIGFDERHETSYELLLGDLDAESIAVPTQVENLSIIPATMDLSSADTEIVNRSRRVMLLRDALRNQIVHHDFVVVDCPPSLNLLTINALVAADGLIVPLQAEFFALEGLSQLLITVREVRSSANENLRLEGVVLTMFDQRNNLCQQVEQDVRDHLGDLVYETRIPRNVRLSEAPSHAMPVLNYDPTSRGAIAYRNLAAEFLNRLKMKELANV